MPDMPRPRPPYLRREVTRHGNVVWYVRLDEGRRIRIRAAFGTPEFEAEYRAALDGTPRPAKGGPAADSIAWLHCAVPEHGRMGIAVTGIQAAAAEHLCARDQGRWQSAVH
jgi:hypothetical protein